MGHAVEEEAEALGKVAQVGGLAVEEEEEEEALELRVAHPLVPLLGVLCSSGEGGVRNVGCDVGRDPKQARAWNSQMERSYEPRERKPG